MSEESGTCILIVDNDPGDEALIRRLFQQAGHRPDIRGVRTADEALDYLARREAWAAPGAAPRPQLLLLDLNLPGMPGLALLEILRKDPGLAALPIIVLTTSSDEEEVARSYALGANSFITKPGDLEGFRSVVKTLGDLWLRTAILPGTPGLP